MTRAGLQTSPAPSPVLDRRRVVAADRELLFKLFCHSLAPNNTFSMLPQPERDSLLRMQFEAREQQYRSAYPLADFELLLLDGVPVGNLYVDRGDDQYVLIDISVLPKFRGQGVGTRVVSSLLEEADRLALPVRAHVQKHNPAWGLWQRLGFELVGDEGVYYDIIAPANRS